ncbi:50S ribosomal protein L25 [bacterium]|nr:50S ribosomal protein L25 [bacterium]
MDKIILSADLRQEAGKAVKKLRESGKVPAVLYGRGAENKNITLDAKEFGRILNQAGYSSILELSLDGKKYNVLIQDVAFDVVKSEPIHADIYLVKMDEVIRTEVPLHFVGESTAVFQQDGSLITNLEALEIEALPGNLPQQIEVDISVLDDFEKTITVADVKLPADVKLLTDAEELVARVEPPRSDEELEALDEEIVENIPAEEGSEEAAEGEQEKAGE